jgi:NADH dehydrogenase FAD-containing subunit
MVVAVGAATNFYGVDETHCYSLKDIQDVKEIRDRLEKIETAVIAGGGSTGIEAAGALLEASEDLDIKVIQAEDRLLTQNLEKLSEKTEKLLAGRGVEIIKNTLVTKVNLDSVEVNSGKRVDSDLTIWAGGLKNREILEETDLPTDKDGVKTEKTMKVEGRDDIYAVGDAASYSGGEKRAFHALKEAKTAASNIKRELEGKKNLEEKGHIWDPQLIYMGGTTGLEIGKRSHIGRLPDIMRRYFVDKRYMYLRKNIL